MHNMNSFPELSGHQRRELLRMFLSAVWGGDLMKLCDLFGEYDASSPEYRFLSGFMDIVEIDFAVLSVRICRELRTKYPVFAARIHSSSQIVSEFSCVICSSSAMPIAGKAGIDGL